MKQERQDHIEYKLVTLNDGQEIVTALPNGIEIEVTVGKSPNVPVVVPDKEITKAQFEELLTTLKGESRVKAPVEELQTKGELIDTIEDSKQEQI